MQRHYITAVFSDLCDSTKLANTSDPEIVMQFQSQVRKLAMQIANEYGGVINQHYGDGTLALFGLPKPGEDDVLRATLYTMDLHQRVKSLTPASQTRAASLHSGIDSGLVAFGHGAYESGVFEVYGDPLNIAARLSAQAQSDEIFANQQALGVMAEYFVTEPLGGLHLKGIANPVDGVKILSRSDVQSRFQASRRRGLTSFQGRDEEIAQIQQHLREPDPGLRIVSIVGPPGIGKTRLLDEASSLIDSNATILRGYCEPEAGAQPLRPFVNMLLSQLPKDSPDHLSPTYDTLYNYLENIDPSLTGHTRILAAALAISDSAVQKPGLAVTAFSDWCLSLTRRRDVTMIIDDWQWADDASRELIGNFCQAAPKGAVLLGSRHLQTGDPAERGCVIKLQPLSEEATGTTVDLLLPNNVTPGTRRLVVERSGGNPLFIEELCHSIRSRQAGVDAHSPGFIPATLFGLIEQKVGNLSEEARQTAFAAAVIGDRVPLTLLQTLHIDLEVIAELADQDVLHVHDLASLAFKHGVTREVVHSLIPMRQKQSLHGKVAQVLRERAKLSGTDEPVERLAHHYAMSDQHHDCASYAQSAGDKALATNTLDRARFHYQQGINALRMLPRDPQTYKRWRTMSTRWALACTYAPSLQTVAVLKELADWAGELDDQRGLAEAEYYLGWLYYALGDQPQSLHFSLQALDRAKAIKADKLVAQLYACIGQSAAAAGDYAVAHEHLDLAIDIKQNRKPSANPPIGWAYAVSCKALVLGDEGHFAKADDLMHTAIQRVQHSGQAIEASVVNMYGTMRSWRGHWQVLIDTAPRVQRMCERHSLPYVYASSRSSESYARWKLHGDQGALGVLAEATELLASTEMKLYYSLNCGWMADFLCDTGDYANAADQANEALKFVELGDSFGAAMAYRALHKIAVRSQLAGLQSPDTYLQAAYAAAQARNSRHEQASTLLLEAEYRRLNQQLDQSRQLALQATEHFAAMQMVWHGDQTQMLLKRLDT